jgi:hypothetical protein
MKGYVTRMTDLSELEDWITAGLPVGLSLCYDRLRGKGPGPNGHLVVCVGFTKAGDPIINDPGTSKNVRKIFLRKNLIYAWAYSRNAAYHLSRRRRHPQGPLRPLGFLDRPSANQDREGAGKGLERRMTSKPEIILYQTEDNRTRIEVRLENETVWLTQNQMAELFQTSVPNVGMHIRNIFNDNELQSEATIKDFLTVQNESRTEI